LIKPVASKCNFLCQKCAKTHLRAFVTSKNFPGATPNIKGKGRRGRAEEGKRGRKERDGREGGKGERAEKGKGGEGREGRGGRGKGEVNPPTSKS
jgi:hypothetical protein